MSSKQSSPLKKGDLIRVVKDLSKTQYNGVIAKVTKLLREDWRHEDGEYDIWAIFDLDGEEIEDAFLYEEVELIFSV